MRVTRVSSGARALLQGGVVFGRRLAKRLLRTPLEDLPDSPDLFRDYRRLARRGDLQRRPGGWVYYGRFYPDYLTAGGASHAIIHTAQRYCSGNGLDVGAGLWPLPGAVPVDIWRGPGSSRSIDSIPDGSQDYLFSSHCLEHIVPWREALASWVRKVRPGGVVFLYLPHPSCAIWWPHSPFVGADHKWTPTPNIIKRTLEVEGCTIIACDDGPDAMMSFFVCARREPLPGEAER